MFNDKKLISVIMPAYNCAKYISEAIESVLSQTYKNLEIIVVNDGSIDNTEDILQPFTNSGLINYFSQENKGPSAARNRGLKEGKGEYVAFLDADDLWNKDKLEKSVNFLEKNNFDWVCTSMIKFKQNGEKFIKRIPDNSFALNFSTKEVKQLTNGIFFFSSVAVHTPTIIVKRMCFDKVGMFDESFLICEDTDLWLRFEEAGFRGGYLDEPLTIYRYNEKSLTKGRKVDGLEESAKVAKKHALILGLNNNSIKKSYSGFLWQVADLYWTDKRFIKTAKYMLKSLFHNPAHLRRVLRRLSFNNNESLWKK